MTGSIDTIIAQSADLLGILEDKRKRYLQLYTMGVPMAFAVICAIAAMKVGGSSPFPWVLVGFLAFAIALIGFQIVNGLYRAQTKKAFLGQLAAIFDLTYHRQGVFPIDDFAHHRLLPSFDKINIEDGFIGTYNGVDIAFQETQLTEVIKAQSQNEQDRETTLFWGLLVKIKIGKVLDAHTVVLPRNALQTFFRTTFSKFEKINLVSPTFEHRFSALGTDQVEARYVLDPAFIEHFIATSDLLGTKWVGASFKGNEIALAIQHNRPMFEIGWLGKPLTEKSLGKVITELHTVIQIIDTLKLNPYTGLGASLQRPENVGL